MRLKADRFRISIDNERQLTRFVVAVTAACAAIALAVDVTNQLIFFEDWATCFRSWTITVVLVLVLAVPISRVIGRAHLELNRARMLAETLSRTDQLTGLPNRHALIERVQAGGSKVLALVIVDIDWFKRVNDTYGHLAGDAVIRTVGQMMTNELGHHGMVARIGGEEFALISSELSTDSVVSELSRFRDTIGRTPIVVGGVSVRVTISAGVAVRRNEEPFDTLFSDADRALYFAKKSGRNRVCSATTLDAAGGSKSDAGDSGARIPRRTA